jgi:putative permease
MNTNTKILLVFLLLTLGGVMIYTAYAVGAIVALFLLSALFAFIISPSVSFLERSGLPRSLAAVVMFVLFFGSIGIAIYLISPLMYEEFGRLQEIISVGQLRRGIRDIETFLSRNLSFLGVRRLHVAPKVEEWVGALFDNILNIASGVVGLVLFIVMMLISTFFLLKDARMIKKELIAFVPNKFFEMSLSVVHKIEWSLGAYLRGILLDAFVIGIMSTFALWLINVPNYALIGIVAGLANLVPYLGPPTAALVASTISVATNNSFDQVPLILFVFSVIRLIDDSVVQPLTISQSVRLHPLIIIFALLIGGQLFGIIGMLFAVPTVGVLKVILSELYVGFGRFKPS